MPFPSSQARFILALCPGAHRRSVCRGGIREALAGALLLLIGAGVTMAQTPSPSEVEVPVPLAASSAARAAESGAQTVWEFALGQSALESGFHSLAESFFRSILENENLDEASQRRIRLALVSSLIGQARADGAAEVLEAVPEPRDGAWWVRRASVDWMRQDADALGTALDQIDPVELSDADQATYHFLRASQFDRAGDLDAADEEYQQAFALSPSRAQLALFRLAQIQGRLVAGEATEGLAATLKQRVDENTGRTIGFQFALQYAVVLDLLGRRSEAIEVLSRQRDVLQTADAELRDRTLLILGLVATAETPVGQAAFRELLITGSDPELQRAALIRLAANLSPAGEPEGGEFGRLLNDLLERQPPHPLTEELLFFRAELALRNRDYENAEADVETLLTRFPGTDMRRQALAVLANSSWQRQRFRNAAAHLTELREGLPAGRERAWLSVLLGESYFRAGMQFGTAEDFRNAAEAYGTAYTEVAQLASADESIPGVPLGTIFFQRVLAALRGGNHQEAAALLDDPTLREGVDTESWWQAEWNLVRNLQLTDRFEEAFARVESLGVADAVPAELRLRFLWLAAQLTVETGRLEETEDRVSAVTAFLESAETSDVSAELRTQVASSVSLLRAEALLNTGETEAGLAALEELRTEFPGTRAALYSYIVQARSMAAENRLADAQQILVNLADSNRESEYAPLALYEAALQAERRGQDAFLSEAGQLLERLATEYPEERYAFPARLKQADIARRLNQFAVAEQIYRYLENTYPNNPGRSVVQLALADTLLAQAETDPAKFEGAVTRLERLAVLPSAEADLRAEAGFKLAYAWQIRGNRERAMQLYWDLYQRFLGAESRAANTGTTWRYWVSRSLLELGQLEEEARRRDKARELYEAVLEHGLPGGKIARGRLARFPGGG